MIPTIPNNSVTEINKKLAWIAGRLLPNRRQVLDHTSHATPGTEKALTHTLGRVPDYYIAISQDAAGSLYLGSTAWTDTTVYFKCDAGGVAFKVMLF